MPCVSKALAVLRRKIRQSARCAGRDGASVTLVAVSKTQPVEAIRAALACGQRVFGENRVAEASAKFSTLKSSFSDLRLHLIGPLQTNKAVEAVRLFDVIETLDRPSLARALAVAIAKQGRSPCFLIEVNIGAEPQKAGVLEKDLDPLLSLCRELGLHVDGLMAIPPVDSDPEPFFARLKELADRHSLARVSMGMSADFEKAIAHGATHVRIGSALFGSRAFPAKGSAL